MYTVTCWQHVASRAMAWMDCHVTSFSWCTTCAWWGPSPQCRSTWIPFSSASSPHTPPAWLSFHKQVWCMDVCHEGGSTGGIYLTVVTKRRTLMVIRRIKYYEKYTGWDWCGFLAQVSCWVSLMCWRKVGGFLFATWKVFKSSSSGLLRITVVVPSLMFNLVIFFWILLMLLQFFQHSKVPPDLTFISPLVVVMLST